MIASLCWFVSIAASAWAFYLAFLTDSVERRRPSARSKPEQRSWA